MITVVLVTGGFDPIHSGHISYLKAAKLLGDKLVVGLNSDEWLARKKGRAFMPIYERAAIIRELECVDDVIPVINDDKYDDAGGAIFHLLSTHGSDTRIIVANGGDRVDGNVLEQDTFGDHPRIDFVFGIGGEDKKNSSSWILEEWKSPKTQRSWGYYRVLHELKPCVKLKELTVDPGSSLSMQKHALRNEHWFVSQGTATLYTMDINNQIVLQAVYNKHQHLHIPANRWHKLVNNTDQPLCIIEIQYGENCIEEDITRYE